MEMNTLSFAKKAIEEYLAKNHGSFPVIVFFLNPLVGTWSDYYETKSLDEGAAKFKELQDGMIVMPAILTYKGKIIDSYRISKDEQNAE